MLAWFGARCWLLLVGGRGLVRLEEPLVLRLLLDLMRPASVQGRNEEVITRVIKARV